MSSTNDNMPEYPDVSPDELSGVDTHDEQGAPIPEGYGMPIATMTDRELMEELVYQGREMRRLVGEFQTYVSTLSPGDIFKMLLGGKKSA